jgi:trans-2,3-dihydro-3-hydroxyanthranilate isomerase
VRSLRYVVADVFTDTPLAGNQLGVFTDARDLDSLTMQALAKEMAFSETVFVLPKQAEDADVRIRIFTPGRELPFAGHPVLGTAFVLGIPLQRIVIRLETGVGVVPVELEREGAEIRFGWMNQPVPSWESFAAAGELADALGVPTPELPVEWTSFGPGAVYVEVPTVSALSALDPDSRALGRLTDGGAYCFARDGGGWRARMFLPGAGIAEDPATGSAAGPFVCYLVRHGRVELGEEIRIEQGVEIGRPSTLFARAEGNGGIETVRVGGSAVVVARGEFRIP